jgi:molybdate transport system ATP-binding protein
MLTVDVRHSRGDFTISAVFEVPTGVTGLFGPSGAGKSMLLSLIAGLSRPGSGRITLGERVLFDAARGVDLPPQHRRVGMVFQDSRLFPHLSVRQNLMYGSRFSGRRGGDAGLEDVVDLLGLGELLSRMPRRLSGGERQRVAIGRTLLSGPEVLLLDEPLASLDASRRADILPYLDQLARHARLPVLYVSHAIEEVERLAERIVVLDGGEIVAAGAVADVVAARNIIPVSALLEARRPSQP